MNFVFFTTKGDIHHHANPLSYIIYWLNQYTLGSGPKRLVPGCEG